MATTLLAPLPFILRLCSVSELQQLSQVSREMSSICELEWRLRTLACFGKLRFSTSQWRRCFLLRTQFQRKVVEKVTARIYLINNRGEMRYIPIERGTPLLCSKERAIVYHRCKRMFDFSLRINQSIQEISTFIGMVSVDEARGLLNEHMSLMTSVAALRGSLHFESELFEIVPAPVLLDTNALLRVTYKFQETQDTAFLQSSSFMMMQMWVSIDGLIYRPLSSPAIIQPTLDQSQQHENEEVVHGEEEGTTYSILKLHELSGMSMTIDDNTLRYRLQGDELCVNALVSNTYLLYLFNPLQYRPLDWTFNAMLQIGETRYVLPVQREGVFLNTTSYALRIFISYGKLPKKPLPLSSSKMMTDEAKAVENPLTGGACGAEDSGPLDIPYNGQREIFTFRLTATNRISKKTCVVASKAACLSLVPSANSAATGEGVDRQQSIVSSSTLSNEEENTDESDTSAPSDCAVPHFERHVHLPFDAMICYYFAPNCSLQYVEFAIGFEPLMHLLGVAVFLPEGMTAC